MRGLLHQYKQSFNWYFNCTLDVCACVSAKGRRVSIVLPLPGAELLVRVASLLCTITNWAHAPSPLGAHRLHLIGARKTFHASPLNSHSKTQSAPRTGTAISAARKTFLASWLNSLWMRTTLAHRHRHLWCTRNISCTTTQYSMQNSKRTNSRSASTPSLLHTTFVCAHPTLLLLNSVMVPAFAAGTITHTLFLCALVLSVGRYCTFMHHICGEWWAAIGAASDALHRKGSGCVRRSNGRRARQTRNRKTTGWCSGIQFSNLISKSIAADSGRLPTWVFFCALICQSMHKHGHAHGSSCKS